MTSHLKTALSLGIMLSHLDSAAMLASYRNIGNRALGSGIFAAQQVLRNREALLAEREATLDGRNELDDISQDREPPSGIEPAETAEQRLAKAMEIYATCLHHCTRLGINEYDLPQDLRSRLDWVVQRAAEALKTRPVAFHTTAEKLAFAARVGQAKTDHEFWLRNGSEVAALVEDALGNVSPPDDDSTLDVLDTLDGVDAHQYAIQAGIGVQNAIVRLETALLRFPVTTMIGKSMASDIAGLQTSLAPIKAFVERVEEAYAGEIQSAIVAGRNLLSTEAIDAAYSTAVDRTVERALQTQAQFTTV